VADGIGEDYVEGRCDQPDPWVQPTDVFPVEDLIRCGEATLRRDASMLLQYSQAGYSPLREWIAARYGVGPERLLTGNSSVEIFAHITQVLLEPGQRIFIESLSYDRSITLLRRQDAVVVGIPLEAVGIDLEALEAELDVGAPALMEADINGSAYQEEAWLDD